MIRELANGREVEYKGSHLRLPVGPRQPSSRSGWRPTARRRWRSPARSATASSCSSPTPTSPPGRSRRCGDAAERAGRDPDAIKICVAAPAYVGDDLPHSATSAAGSAGWWATTSPTSSPATATTAAPCPPALTDYIKGRQGYDYNEHGRAGNTHTAFVPDDIVDRFCILGPAEHHVERLAAS